MHKYNEHREQIIFKIDELIYLVRVVTDRKTINWWFLYFKCIFYLLW